MEHMVTYIEAQFLCIIFLSTLFMLNLKHWRPRVLNSLSLIYILTILSSLLDIAWSLVDGKPDLVILNHIINIVHLSCFGFIGFFWMDHCSTLYPFQLWKSRWHRFIGMLPAITTTILLAISSRTGWIYGIDRDGTYYRGPYYFIQMLAYAYLVTASLLALQSKRQVEFAIEKKKLSAVALFALPPLLLGTIQLFTPPGGLPTTQFSILLSLIMLSINSLESRVTQDSLTGLSNRYVLDRVIANKISNKKSNADHLYVLIGDLDRFKSINDTYGHMAGDRALKLVADVLKKVFHNTSAILTRMGGDEFAIVIETDHMEFLTHTIRQITQELECASKMEPFTLRMSIGIAKYEDGMSMIDLLNKADLDLYDQKRKKSHMLTV